MSKLYLDGVLEYGYLELEDNGSYSSSYKFINKGILYFRNDQLKERDKFKFASEEVNIDMKVATLNCLHLEAHHIIKIDDKLYEIELKELNTKILESVLFLKEHENFFSEMIDIFVDTKVSKFDEEKLVLLKRIAAKVVQEKITFENIANDKKTKKKYSVTLSESDEIKEIEKKNSLESCLIIFDDDRLTINHINTISRKNGLYELICEGI